LLIQEVKVCLSCGNSRFITPEGELTQLAATTEKGSLCLETERRHLNPDASEFTSPIEDNQSQRNDAGIFAAFASTFP
jgi:hypothetical protein